MLSSLAFNDGDGTVKIDKSSAPATTETAKPATTPVPVESTPAETAPKPE